MEKINKILTSAAIIALAILNLNGCTKEKKSVHPTDILRIDLGGDASTIDPAKSDDAASTRVVSDLFAGLVDFDQQNRPIPGMASKWDISEDGKTYTFHLRHNLKFSNDSPINANDVLYTYRRIADPKTGAKHNYLLSNVLNGQAIISGQLQPSSLGVSAKDPYTIVIKLNNPDPNFLNILTNRAFGVVSSSVIDRYKNRWTEHEHIVTSGAYVLTEHVTNGYTLLKKNPYFYAANDVHIPFIKYISYPNRKLGIINYKTGNIDIVDQSVPADQYKALKEEFPRELHTVLQEGMYFYDLNQKIPTLANKPKLREALSLAIDRNLLTTEVLGNDQTELYASATPTIDDGDYKDIQIDFSIKNHSEQIELAKKLYAEAGYDANNPLKLTLTHDNNELDDKIATAVAEMWTNNLGVKTTLVHEQLKIFSHNRHQVNYEIAQDHFMPDYDDVENYADLFICNSPQNNSHYCNTQYDTLIKQAKISSNSSQKRQLYHQALGIIMQDYPIIPLFQPTYTKLIKPYIKNFKIENNHFNVEQSKWIQFSDAK